MVPLLGDNHILVRFGLEVLKKSSKPGVRALLEAAGLAQRDISPGHLGFVLGPRINASGRMHSASLALELLTTTDAPRALQLARELEKLNEERASVQNAIWDEVRVRVEQGIAEGKFEHGIVVADPGWHEGVVGIVASRVTETFRRPAAVIAIRHDPAGQSGAQPGQESYDFAKGSVRSFAGKDVLAALRASAEHLLGFGGHRHAAGLSLKPENIDAFAAAFDAALGGMEEDVGARPLMIEGECAIDELDVRTLQEIERLGPFGPGNPEPVFSVRGTVRHHTVLKGRHLKLTLSPVGASRRAVMEAIWFNAAERPELLDDVTTAELEGEFAGVPELNRFRGNVTPTLRVRDWRRARPPL
jgi:single-stranded-DNA-specific exonuclease